MRVQEALKELGYDTRRPCRGTVLVDMGRNKFKHYAFRYRSGDGHMLWRWGRFTDAYKQEISGLIIFRTLSVEDEAAHILDRAMGHLQNHDSHDEDEAVNLLNDLWLRVKYPEAK